MEQRSCGILGKENMNIKKRKKGSNVSFPLDGAG
jgi:hypothetical protein